MKLKKEKSMLKFVCKYYGYGRSKMRSLVLSQLCKLNLSVDFFRTQQTNPSTKTKEPFFSQRTYNNSYFAKLYFDN
jgi:hypothetical protein